MYFGLCLLDSLLKRPLLSRHLAECNAQADVEKLQRLEKEANAANQEVVLLSDELEKRDALVEQLQEDVQALKQQLEGQRQASKQLEETVSARCDCRWMGFFALKFTLPPAKHQ